MTRERAIELAATLAKKFTAHVEPDEVSPGRFRFDVLSKHFGDRSLLDLQDDAWAVVDSLLARKEADDISLILTIGPEDVDESLVALMP